MANIYQNIISVFEEYEQFLQTIVDTNGLYDNVSQLIEERGTNYDEFSHIVDAILATIQKCKFPNDNKRHNSLVISNIQINNSFIKNFDFILNWDKQANSDAFVNYHNAFYDKQTNAMHHFTICYNEYNFEYPQYDKYHLKECLWHELQHLYRQYHILKNESVTNKINNKNTNYSEINALFNDSAQIQNVIKNTFYYTDKNEINSHINEIVPYIENHKEINFNNYKVFLDKIPGYDVIIKLHQLADVFNNPTYFQNEKFINIVGKTILDNVYKHIDFYKGRKLTYAKIIKKTRLRINMSLLYTQRQFYKLLSYALDKCLREGKHRMRTKRFSREWLNIFEEYKKMIYGKN